MNTRDILTIIGGLCSAIGAPLIATATNTTSWWIGVILSATGPSLIASRSIIKEPKE